MDYVLPSDMVVSSLQELDPDIRNDRSKVVTTVHGGEFLKPCPGTGGGYFCCGYQILTPVTGCGMLCDYCILQSYFDHQCQVVFSNTSDLGSELYRKLSAQRGIVRLGTGEFADSLFLETRVRACQKVAQLVASFPNVVVEFKTKHPDLEAIAAIGNHAQVVIGFSMNTERMIACHERGTASLDTRLRALRACVELGYWVAIHFDPMFWYPQWNEEYRELTRRIFSAIPDPGKIAWWSLGGFRTVPALKSRLKEQSRHLGLFSGELVHGADGKLRYFRPLRGAMYRAVREEVDALRADTTLYLCMESEELWQDSGMIKRIPQGLVAYLDNRAAVMLGVEKTKGTE